MKHTDIEEILEKAMGLKITTIGSTSFERALKEHMEALGINNEQTYADRLKKSSTELDELIERVVIPETWFFRDQYPFTAMVQHLSESWNRSIPLKILSIPCSSGEEPYSIAMALLLAGIKKQHFSIDAIDISRRAIERAQKGVFTQNSFRVKDLSFRDIFFTRDKKHFIIKDNVRKCVRFLQGNIIDDTFVNQFKDYDVIFCRNVLIYFDKHNQRKVIDTLWEALSPEGLLFTGHVEGALFLQSSFTSLNYKKAFAFQKMQNDKVVTKPLASKAESFKSNHPIPSLSSKHHPQQSPQPPLSFDKPKTLHAPKTIGDDLDHAKQLANQGFLAEAEKICTQNLDEHGPSAQSYFLLGLIRDSKGETVEAMKLLRKAVYLNPQHHDSLVQLSLLAEQAGDLIGAKNYQRRALNLQQNGVKNCAE